MTDEKESFNRRAALKGIAAGLGTTGGLPILNSNALGQRGLLHGDHSQKAVETKPPTPRFFNARELAAIGLIAELIIPSDGHSPGALAAQLPAFIDLMVSESPVETKTLWREGLVVVEQMSWEQFKTDFARATVAQ